MLGIIGFGAYIPKNRLSRAEIARAWSGTDQGGERSVANYDEDAITMAVAAALDSFGSINRSKLDGLFFASTSSPYAEKQAATLIAKVLDLSGSIFTADFAGTLRAGTGALRLAFDSIKGGGTSNVFVVGSECRVGAPRSDFEQILGDAAGSVLVGDGDAVATLEGSCSVSEEIVDVWRTAQDIYPRSWEDRFVIGSGYSKSVTEAVNTLLTQKKISPKEINKAILYSPDGRSYQGLARGLGLDTKSQVQDPLFAAVGNSGTASPLLLLAAALEEAKPGDLLLLASYGDGSDALLFRVQEGIKRFQKGLGVKGHLKSKRMLANYEKYLRFRDLLETPTDFLRRRSQVSSASAMWRDRSQVLSLHGSRCRQCSMITFPIQRVCYACQAVDDYEEIRLYEDKGKVFTFTMDNLAGGYEPPQIMVCLEMPNGSRIYCEMTECEHSEVKIEMPVEMTFRKVHEGAGFYNYFWKARPVR